MKNHLKVLIADNSELMRMIVKGFLYKRVIEPAIFETSNLPDTFTLLKKDTFDFLLLDINMPLGDSNPETVKEILAIQPNLKVCMFTGNERSAFEQLYIDAGAIAFIQKDENLVQSLELALKMIID